MRYVGDKIRAKHLGLGELLCHRVEAFDYVYKIFVGKYAIRRGNTNVEIAAHHLCRRIFYLLCGQSDGYSAAQNIDNGENDAYEYHYKEGHLRRDSHVVLAEHDVKIFRHYRYEGNYRAGNNSTHEQKDHEKFVNRA